MPDLFRIAFATSAVPVVITTPERPLSRATILFANEAATAALGYGPDELAGRSADLLVGTGQDGEAESRHDDALHRSGVHTASFAPRRKDGSVRHGRWTLSAIREGENPRGWLAIEQDGEVAAEGRLRALIEGIPHLVWQSRDGGDWCAASPQWEAFTGQSAAASLGSGWRDRVLSDDLAVTDAAWRDATRDGVMTVEHRIRRHDGTSRWFQTRALPLPADAPPGPDRVWIGTSTDVDDLRRAEERVRHLAFHDLLTDTGNREMLDRALDGLTRQGAPPQPFNVLSLDLDGFRRVNDQLGYRCGDRALREVARRLARWVRATDLVTRVGGDEFVLVQRDAAAADGVRLAERIAVRMAEPFLVSGQEIRLQASLGLASCPADGTEPETLLRRADLALGAAKSNPGSHVSRFEMRMERASRDRVALQNGLAGAIARDELAVVYQTIHDAATGTLHGYEALARWQLPGHGSVPPSTFIPIAEEGGLIVPIGRFVLDRACRDAMAMASDGQVMSVNVSPAQFRSGRLAAMVAEALARSGLSPERLELEVTEHLLMDPGEGVDRTLRAIKASGVRIALDDFGTGYSSLGYLCRFPFDRLKIDQSFVRRMSEDDGARAVVGGIIALAHSLRLSVTAEGVETGAQLDALRAMGCDQVQGFLLGRPMPAASADLAETEAGGR